MNLIDEATNRIISEQALIMGPIAWQVAHEVSGLDIGNDQQVHVKGESKTVLENLVQRYQGLFGRTSVEVCRDAIRPMISQLPKEQIPSVLL